MSFKTKIKCPHCGVAIRAKPEHANKRGKCPACKKPFEVQLVEESAVDESAAATIQTHPDMHAETIHLTNPAALQQKPEANGSEPESKETPQKLGRFQLRRLLGQGAFGRVYLAYDPQLDRQLALKVPTFETHEARKIQRFISEAKAAARLRHPNIVPTHESGQVNGQYYIASQYIAGETLASRLAERPPDFRHAAEWIRQLAEGLAYAHSQGVVHRDIKPANIMLDEDDVPQIMDFGLAKRLNDDAAMTIDGSVLGTPAYMAPEQARGDSAQVNASSDQYSLGVVLYELLTGERPFTGPSHAVIASVLTQDPPPPRARRKDVPRDLDAICQVAMHKQQAGRYASTQELAQDLANWLNESPVKARTISLGERFTRWLKREPRVAALIAVVVVLLIVGVSVSTLLAVQANHNLHLANVRAEQLDAAVKTADAERQRANVQAGVARDEADGAKQAKDAANQQAAEAVAARKDAESARIEANRDRQLAAAESQRLQGVLDELEKSQGAIADKTKALLKASEEKKEAEEAGAREKVATQIALAKGALSRDDFELARQHLEKCPFELRTKEWHDLSSVADSLAVQFIDVGLAGQTIYLDPNDLFAVYGGSGSLRIRDLQVADKQQDFTSSSLIGVGGAEVLVRQPELITLVGKKTERFPVNERILDAMHPVGFSRTRQVTCLWLAKYYNSTLFLNCLELDPETCHYNIAFNKRVMGRYSRLDTSRLVIDFERHSFLMWDGYSHAFLVDFRLTGAVAEAVAQPHLDKHFPDRLGRYEFRNGLYAMTSHDRISVFDSEKVVAEITAPGPLSLVAVCPRGFFVAGVWNENTIGIWRLKDRQLIRQYKQSNGLAISDIDFNSHRAAWVGAGGVESWTLPDNLVRNRE